jgi:hypothetical protein
MSCSGINLKQNDIQLFKSYADSIEKSISNKTNEAIQNDIRIRTIGKTGYYSVMDNQGIILAHPSIAIIGKNANEYDKNYKKYSSLALDKDQYYFYSSPNGTKSLIYLRKIENENRIIRITNPIKIFLNNIYIQ